MTKTVLITTSGTGDRLGDITKYTNKSLVKVGDKYAICYIIDAYDDNTEYVITLGYYGNYVQQFLLLAYPKKKFVFVEIDVYIGEGSSLGYSMLKAKEYLQKPFIFHCCDSIITNKINIPYDENILYVYPNETSEQYTNIKGVNNIVTKINEKGYDDYDYIYTGITYIKDYENFWINLDKLYNNDKNNNQLNDVNSINSMINQNIIFKYIVLDNWYDTGNIKSYKKIKEKIKSKYSVIEKNYESLCFINDKVIKFINDKEINKKRVLRGDYLYPLSPKILNSSENFLVMELVDGELLSTVYETKLIYNLLKWSKENLWNKENKSTEYIDCCKRFYIDKTIDRLSKIKFLNDEKNIINGLTCKNVINYIKELPKNLIENDIFVKFHGDFILDNVIKTKDSFKLIDWRQEFDNQLYYGDIYYELAKLRHNIIFNHSNILNNLFRIDYIENEVIVDLKCNYFLIEQLNDFERFVNDNNYDSKKIKILTSIIWLNMSPLYEGKISEFLFYFGKYNLCILL